MQLQPYQAQDPAAGANGDRISVPTSAGHPAAPAQPPTLLTVFGRQVRQRKRLVAVWALVTAVVTGTVVFQFARPLYRAEGKYSYRPNYNTGPKPLYTPPNIQSAIQILKAAEVLDPVRERHLPDVAKDQFARDVRIEVSRQSEFIDVAYDHPDPQVAAAVANDLMQEGIKHFERVRVETSKGAVDRLRQNYEEVKRQHDEARNAYRDAHDSKGIVNPEAELDAIKLGLTEIDRALRIARTRKAELKLEIAYEKKRLEAPADATDAALDETLYPLLQQLRAEIQHQRVNEREIEQAKADLKLARDEEARMRPLTVRGVHPRSEYDKVVAQMRRAEAVLKESDALKEREATLNAKIEELRQKSKSGPPVRRTVIESLAKLYREQETIPTTLATLDKEYEEKRKALTDFTLAQRELDDKKDMMELLWGRRRDLDSQLRDAGRGQDLNASDLRVHSPASAGTGPFSTNAPKLALALIGASGFLFVGYMFLFGMPKLEPGPANALAGGPESRLPRALVALVPFAEATGPGRAVSALLPGGTSRGADGQPGPPYAEPAVPSAGAILGAQPKPPETRGREPGPVPPHTLAERLAEDGVDHGGIVLFTPTAEELKVAPAIGEMGQFFTRRGERVLVFDARHEAETPSWAGPDAPAVARTVEGYLDGRAAAAKDCFVPTSLIGIEYSRADLSTRVAGVMAAHRFRQLVEEMRERYSLVFLVGPPVTVPGGDQLLSTLAEGMVLVTEASASPSEVHAFVESLSQQGPARLYGTLSVPRA